jgi:hypothetical protein
MVETFTWPELELFATEVMQPMQAAIAQPAAAS